MRKYLTAGVLVQIFIIILRWMLGKSRGILKEQKSNVYFWILLLLGSIINIVLWPVTIVSEIILTKEKM